MSITLSQGDVSSGELKKLLKAQLSHSDGIRGFMVSFLTTDDDSQNTSTMPDVLVEVLKEQVQSNPDELIPLACTKEAI